jgi:peptide/nickel transport system permease protein
VLKVIGWRLVQAVVSLLVVTAGLFLVLRLTGRPENFIAHEGSTLEQRAQLRAALGLDQPLYKQFMIYIDNVVHGDLGNSYSFGVPVADLIRDRFPNTIILTAGAMALTLAIAVPMGVYAAYWRGGRLDNMVRVGSGFGQSLPSFWFGLILILVFAVHFKWLPAGNAGGIDHIILPALTLAFEPIARLTRLLRSSVIEELSSDYVTFLRMKGMSERTILWKHVLRNSALTAMTFVGILLIGFLAGSVLVETVFSWPGIGQLMTDGLRQRDFAVVQGVSLVVVGLFIIGSLIVDLLYAVLNPRLRTK